MKSSGFEIESLASVVSFLLLSKAVGARVHKRIAKEEEKEE